MDVFVRKKSKYDRSFVTWSIEWKVSIVFLDTKKQRIYWNRLEKQTACNQGRLRISLNWCFMHWNSKRNNYDVQKWIASWGESNYEFAVLFFSPKMNRPNRQKRKNILKKKIFFAVSLIFNAKKIKSVKRHDSMPKFIKEFTHMFLSS